MLNRLRLSVLKAVLVMLDKVFILTRKKVVPLYPYDKRTQTINLPQQVEKQLRHLIADDNKVEAIRQVAQLTGANLRLSKNYVDRMEWEIRGEKIGRRKVK